MNMVETAFADEVDSAAQEAAYTEWLRAKVQEAIDDPSPPIPHEEVMANMFALVEHLKKKSQGDA